METPKEFLKKSANNKFFDRGGFQSGKRTPLYNKRYIDKAKKNVTSGIYQDDEEYLDDIEAREEDIALRNREMYRQLAQKEAEKKAYKVKTNNRSWKFWRTEADTDFDTKNQTITTQTDKELEIAALRVELEELKAQLAHSRNERKKEQIKQETKPVKKDAVVSKQNTKIVDNKASKQPVQKLPITDDDKVKKIKTNTKKATEAKQPEEVTGEYNTSPKPLSKINKMAAKISQTG